MSSSDEVRELRAANDDLRRQLAVRSDELAVLTEELAETNKGVVALYAELDDKAEQLRQASELKSRFLSYVTHEFRTPLGAIRSLARILLDQVDGPLNAEQQKQVGFVQSSAVELSEMVDDLLDLAKIEAGRITVSPGWFDLVDLFSALRGMFRPLLANAQTTLWFDEPRDVARLYTDDRKLSQILRNLIANALKFTEKGEVRVSARREGDELVFAVADTGIGIAAADVARLFEDFSQLDSPVQRRVRGTGLGLSLSRKLATLLGGRLSVVSTLGQGSTFSLTIPATCPQPAAAVHTNGAAAPAGRRSSHG
jgi:signal transduction histidine kinase